jgi:predicted GTPase
MAKKNIIIIGAAGRDFHNFNTCFRENDDYRVVAFTAAQIPDIAGRKYPAELAGRLYPEGIPIYAETDLEKLIVDLKVEEFHIIVLCTLVPELILQALILSC